MNKPLLLQQEYQQLQSLKDGPTFNQTTNIKDSSGNLVKVPGGFKVSSDSANNVADGVVIEDSNGSQYVWIPVYSASDLNKNMSYPVRGEAYGVEASSGSYDVSDWNRTGWSFITAEYIANIGGFYVGRYETGNSGGKLVVKKDLAPHIPASMNKALERAAEVYSSDYARTNLITSGTWDRVMSFVNGKTSAAGTRYNVSSNITRTDRMNNIKLGAWANDIVCNISGLGGCLMEYSTECCWSSKTKGEYTILRGGFQSIWTTSGYSTTPALRGIKPNYLDGRTGNQGRVGYRVVLFVK